MQIIPTVISQTYCMTCVLYIVLYITRIAYGPLLVLKILWRVFIIFFEPITIHFIILKRADRIAFKILPFVFHRRWKVTQFDDKFLIYSLGIVHTKMKILSSFTPRHVVPNT